MTNQIQYPQEWTNVGDTNPERYGGLFIKRKASGWLIIETRHYADIHDSVSENQYQFMHKLLENDEVWVNGNPYKGFTEWAINKLNEFNLSFDVENDPYLPENETFEDYVDYYMENHIDEIINSLCFCVNHSEQINYDENYWGYLENYGIEESNF
jgi:hypothetical protein